MSRFAKEIRGHSQVLAKNSGKVLARRETALERYIGDALFVIDRENPAGPFNPAAIEIFQRRHIGQFVTVVSEPASPRPALPRHRPPKPRGVRPDYSETPKTLVLAFDLHQILLMSSQVPTLKLPLRIAMIGSGAVSRHHFPAFRDRPDVIRLPAICEKDPQAAAAFAAQFPYPIPIFAELDDLPDKVLVDAALVVLPHSLRSLSRLSWWRKESPFLVEKPLTCLLEEARALKKLSSATGVPVVVGRCCDSPTT